MLCTEFIPHISYSCFPFTGYSQSLKEPTGTESNCFNGIVEGNCSLPTERAFVTKVNAGAKPSTPNPYNCTSYWTVDIAEECCSRGNNDCYGPYLPLTTDPYAFHKDCVGKYQCSRRAAANMDTIYHTHCDHSSYPAQTSYMDIQFLCIDGKSINRFEADISSVFSSWMHSSFGLGKSWFIPK